MAITKIHPIKSTLKKAIDYIVDPAKTDDKLLVSSFGCAVETADLEFEKTRLLAMQKGNNLAHHLIQAFEPGEVSYAQAHEIGRQLADEILGGKYEYVIATHINKEHCHNHIIFCAVDFAEHKKYISNRKSYAQIRHVSDRLCRENGLSVVTPGAERGKQYAERDAQRKGTSYKQKLKIAIDRLIPISKDLDDLLRRLEAEGYEIKRGKYISFRAPGQERFTRAKTLGEAYTEEAIAERIKGKVILKTPKPERSGVSLLIDIENCIKAQQSAGYERWAKIENLKRAARTMVFLDQHGISHYTDLEQKITELQDSNEQTAAALKTAERRLSDLALLIKYTATYKELKPLYSEYKKSRDKEKYLRGQEREIILFEASARALKAAGVGDKLPDLAKLREEYSRLSEEKDRLYAEYGSLKKRMREYDEMCIRDSYIIKELHCCKIAAVKSVKRYDNDFLHAVLMDCCKQILKCRTLGGQTAVPIVHEEHIGIRSVFLRMAQKSVHLIVKVQVCLFVRRTVVTVSYTHLDVYKRQTSIRANRT